MVVSLRATIESFLESYYVGAATLDELPNFEIRRKELVSRMVATGARLLGQGALIFPESLSRQTFDNVINLFVERGILAERGDDSAATRKKGSFLSLTTQFTGAEKRKDFQRELLWFLGRGGRPPLENLAFLDEEDQRTSS